MIAFGVFFLGVLILAAVLGILVFQSNPRRTINQFYLVLSVFIALWLTSNWYTLNSPDSRWAKLSIQAASVFALMIPLCAHLLRLSILHSQDRFGRVLYRARLLILTTSSLFGLCFTDFFLHHVTMPPPSADQHTFVMPEPVYGSGFIVYASYFTLSLAAFIFLYFVDRKELQGNQRIEMEFVAFGSTASLLIGIFFGLITTILIKSSRGVPFSNAISIMILTSIIAYGIATRRIMGVAHILQRTAAYALLVVYLTGLYFLTWYVAASLLPYTPLPPHLENLIATLVTVFAMSPAHGRLRRFVDTVFQSRSLDIAGIMREATGMLQSLAKTDEVLRDFAAFVSRTFNAERVAILLADDRRFREARPGDATLADMSLENDNPLIRQLRESREPCSIDLLQRFTQTPKAKEVLREMQTRRVGLAMGLYFEGNMIGVLLIGPRFSGQMYDRLDQDTLRILCNELAVAIENAKLYTQVQDGKIYNDILLDNIVSGIIAVNTEDTVTVFNREAQRLTRLTAADVLNHPADILPPLLATALRNTLATGQDLRDADAILPRWDGTTLPVRIGTSIFRGHAGKTLGALMVFHDQTTIRQLEEQIRRSDRLASVGTLAAGMAHEIKNPLVTLKTFSQLLPERYEDPDFRQSFSSLVGREVTRIDAIVNQLLRFSRPVEPSLEPLNLHEVLEHTVSLTQQQLKQRDITFHKGWTASSDLILGDHDLLVQAFLNFYLNAVEAMEDRGTMTVRTENLTAPTGERDLWGQAINTAQIRVEIQDTGRGIPAETVPFIFDPFYTTKANGTGLGLSVAHSIIQKHGGTIEVESKLGLGTTFTLTFPLTTGERET